MSDANPESAIAGVSAQTVSVVIPCRNGGALLERVVSTVQASVDVRLSGIVLVDSGSSADEVARLRSLGARVELILPGEFDHGATRDLGASFTDGSIVVFLNQDALPVDERWLERLVAPFSAPDPPAAVQGGIREFPLERLAEVGRRRFFWDSCGPRFYFTSESRAWIARHGGIGFSTVNCAIARRAWEQLPFGRAAILEDKRWQKGALERGWRIDAVPEAAVWHTHDYSLGALLRRCASEGYGWRLLGERYPLRSLVHDLGHTATWHDWRRGWRSGEMRAISARLFPIVRPLALWWGNRLATRVFH